MRRATDSKKPSIKIDHEFVAAEDELWSSAVFQGSPIMYDGHRLFYLENPE